MAYARQNVVFEESIEIGFNNRNKKVRVSKKLKPLAIIKLSEPSAPLTLEYLFDNINEYEGWLEFNRLENEQYQGYDVDIMDAAYNGISD